MKKKLAEKHPSVKPALSPLENAVMAVVWEKQPVTADQVRSELQFQHALKDSTIRTLLRRLEAKGYVSHVVDGRTYVYRACVQPTSVASSAVREIVERFCAGSVENLLVGLVDNKMISAEQLKELADRIAAAGTDPGTARDGEC
ncbi:MAG: BlaI/MecI/CopY family transcriptional regulator [Planctomycetales bacterium]|nr:BlaI/MecI/CopY family transcriptional regulator [Planctomycetales bacterium]